MTSPIVYSTNYVLFPTHRLTPYNTYRYIDGGDLVLPLTHVDSDDLNPHTRRWR